MRPIQREGRIQTPPQFTTDSRTRRAEQRGLRWMPTGSKGAYVCKHVCVLTEAGKVLDGAASHHFSSWTPPLSLSAVSFHSGVSASLSWASLIRC